MNEVHARVAPRHFRYLEIQSGEFPRSAKRLSVRHNFGNHSPFVSRTCCQRVWIQQERLRSPRARATATRGKDAVAGNNASSEVWQIIEARPFTRHDHIRKQRICTRTPSVRSLPSSIGTQNVTVYAWHRPSCPKNSEIRDA